MQILNSSTVTEMATAAAPKVAIVLVPIDIRVSGCFNVA